MEGNNKIVMVTMEHHVFLHGSSEGQSTIIPSECPIAICDDIANKYFKGRTLRQEKSACKIGLFVDLYSSSGQDYCIYSYVNNVCRGKNDRPGQYISISIMCKDVYVYPEAIFSMLQSAYYQMFNTRKVLIKNDSGDDQFVIAQFSEQKEYFEALLKKIDSVFSSISSNQCKAIKKDRISADYDSWNGFQVCIDSCNSISTFDQLCSIGRIYVSEEYESPSLKVKKLEDTISSLQKEIEDSKQLSIKEKKSGNNIIKKEIDELKRQLQAKDIEIANLISDNTNYKSSIEIVQNELAKFSKAVKSVEKVQNVKPLYKHHDKIDLLKILLLVLILCFTVISSVLSYAFFRHISSSPKGQGSDEIISKCEVKDSIAQDEHIGEMITLEIEPSTLNFESNKSSKEIRVKCGSEWNLPASLPDWISINKLSADCLSVSVSDNQSKDPREYTFMISSGHIETQAKIIQSGRKSFGVVVKANGQMLKSGDSVVSGSRVTATATNAGKTNAYGWQYQNCQGPTGNIKEISVLINGSAGQTATISYGTGNDFQKFTLKIVESSKSEESEEEVSTDPLETNEQ